MEKKSKDITLSRPEQVDDMMTAEHSPHSLKPTGPASVASARPVAATGAENEQPSRHEDMVSMAVHLPSLDIVIVNWNCAGYINRCLESIEQASANGFTLSEVVVVDNASTDGSADGLETLRFHPTVVRNRRNRGFAAACNQGARRSNADYLLFLNPDAQLFEDSLSSPIACMELPGNEKVGILGVQLVNEAGQVARTCARFPTPRRFLSMMLGLTHLFSSCASGVFMTDWDHRTSRDVDHVIGAFFLVRRPVFEALRGFDERFFVYLEDLDFSLRARQAGWRSVYFAEAQAYHEGGGASKQAKASRLFYSLRSRVLYVHKHFGLLPATLVTLGTLFVESSARLVLAGLHFSWQEACDTAMGYGLLFRTLPTTLKIAWSMRSKPIT